MTELSAGLATAFAGRHIVMFCAVEIVFPTQAVRLLDGPASLVLDGDTFAGSDPIFGTLGGLEPVGEGAGDEAPELRVILQPTDAAVAGSLIDPGAVHGAPVRLWIGAVNPVTGAVIGDPYLLFSGEVDAASLRPTKGARTVTFDCVSVFDRFFEDDEGIRLTDSSHQSIWPGELGLQYATDMGRQLPWGQDAPVPSVVGGASSTQPKFNLQDYVSGIINW